MKILAEHNRTGEKVTDLFFTRLNESHSHEIVKTPREPRRQSVHIFPQNELIKLGFILAPCVLLSLFVWTCCDTCETYSQAQNRFLFFVLSDWIETKEQNPPSINSLLQDIKSGSSAGKNCLKIEKPWKKRGSRAPNWTRN